MQPVFRFAPSPNGHLHLGHAFSALLNAELAARRGGRFLVRIEDIDTRRCTERLVADCLEDLAWLGLEWEEPVLRQSTRFACYGEAAAELERRGLLYPCFCTRTEIARATWTQSLRDPEGAIRYPGTCRDLSPEERAERIARREPHAMRLDMTRALRAIDAAALNWREEGDEPPATRRLVPADPDAWGDVVLIRKDVPASYHLAVVIDDAAQGITDIVRGRDLYHATAVHRLLQVLLGLPEPVYRHHRLLTGGDGRKLAKSALSTPLRQLRAEGMRASEIRALLPDF